MGRYSVGCCGFATFGMGITTASFHSGGKVPEARSELKHRRIRSSVTEGMALIST